MAVSTALLFHPESSYLAIMELGEKEKKNEENQTFFLCFKLHWAKMRNMVLLQIGKILWGSRETNKKKK